ncbi:MAG: B12-binding domain-containing radical SAM protein [Candidatus Odinarchaeota archaeon]
MSFQDYPEELNVESKPLKRVHTRIALVYPSTYSIGMSSLGLKLLYSYFNSRDSVACERFFFNPASSGYQAIRSVETGSPLKQFDVIAFTMQFELDYVNAIKILMQSDIPPRKVERQNVDPVIIAGGLSLTANPRVLSPLFDVILRGEFEVVGNRFMYLIEESRGDREVLREQLKQEPHWYSGGDELPDMARVQDLDTAFFPIHQVKPVVSRGKRANKAVVFDGFMLEIVRGCNRKCSYCLIGAHQRPARRRKIETLKTLIEQGLPNNQTNKTMFVGSSTADYPRLMDLLTWMNEKNYSFSLPSLRLDASSDILGEIVKNRQQTITVAPESGSDEVRNRIGKKFTNEEIIDFVTRAKDQGIRNLKLYFITGLEDPTSENEAILTLGSQIARIYSRSHLEITVSAFVPKLSTEFAHLRPDYDAIKTSYRILKPLKKVASVSTYPAKWAWIQSLLSTGTDKFFDVVESVAETQATFTDWKKTLSSQR